MIGGDLMSLEKQVDKSHYEWGRYLSQARWSSVWHQVDEVLKIKPRTVLEIGPGMGVFKQMIKLYSVQVETLDIDPALNPDYVGSATDLPFTDRSFDVVCAFQMLEHLPYETSLQAFKEMARVSKRNVVISLPDARWMWRYSLQLPKFGVFNFLVPRPTIGAPVHQFDGEHYWEINKRQFALSKVIRDFSQFAQLAKTYRVFDNPYHRFFIFKT
jgi:hypothetical protein